MAQEFHLQQSFVHRGFALHIVHRGGRAGDEIGVARELVFERVPADQRAYTAPATIIRYDEAQQLIDELWRVGLRPSEGTGTAGSLRQAEDHIASLKAIAFKLVGVEGKR